MKPKVDMPPLEVLHELLRYDRRTGNLYFRKRPRKYFTSDHRMNNWNSRNAGKRALSSKSRGYLQGPLLGRVYRAHRIIWYMIHGTPPPDQIDHDDGNRSNNRPGNLKAAGDTEQRMNMKLNNRNKTGCPGVLKRFHKWQARITLRGKVTHLGSFPTYGEAVAARKKAERVMGFNKNHGRRA